jgi:hypothetical protein
MYRATVADTFRLYRAALKSCWLPSLLLALCWGWAATLLDRRLGSSDDVFVWLAQVQHLAWSGYFWRLMVAVSAVSALLYSAMVADLYSAATGGATPIGAGLLAAVRAFPGALVAGTLFVMVTSIASVLFIVPGAYLWGMWQLWLVVLVVEHCGPIESLRRSWHLVTGHWWRITTLITVVTIMAIIPSLVFDTLMSSLLILMGRDAAHAPMALTVAGLVLDVFLLPLVPAALVVSYLDRQRAPVVHG